MKHEHVEDLFRDSREYETCIDPQVYVFWEDHTYYVRVEDYYYDVNDPEANRIFQMVQCIDTEGNEYFGLKKYNLNGDILCSF